MKGRLQYIPTERELRRVREEVLNEQNEEPELPDPTYETEEVSPEREPLSKQELKSLLKRLVPTRRTIGNAHLQAIAEQNRRAQMETKQRGGRRVEEKLIQMGKEMKERREEMTKTKQADELKQLRDRPQINPDNNINQAPIKDRYKQVLTEREQHRKEVVKQHRPSFAPQINSYVQSLLIQSKFIAEIRNENDPNVINRLLNEGTKIEQKTNQLANHINQALSSQNTFRPKINNNTSAILRNNPLFQENLLVEQRAQIIQSRAKRQQKNAQVQPECTFKPEICSKSSRLVITNEKVGDRLYRQAQQLIRKKTDRAQSANDRYSFQPKINKNYYQSSCVESDQSYIEEQQSYCPEQCVKTYDDNSTVEKTRNKSIRSSHVESRYLEQSRSRPSQHTASQMQHFTFKPTLHKPIRSTTTLSNVYGLETHLKHCDRARRLKLEQQHSQQKLSLA